MSQIIPAKTLHGGAHVNGAAPANTIEDAGLAVRSLAALIDYILVTALFIVASWVTENSDLWFLFSFGAGAIYFALFNSALARGQTIGKKIFGLRVVSFSGPEVFLSGMQALLRYFFYLGILILVAEIPPLVFRRYAVTSQPQLLESYMFVAMAYFFANIACCIGGREHRALHDRISGSIVIRAEGAPSRAAVDNYIRAPRVIMALPPALRSPSFHCAIGVIIAAFFWSFGFSSSHDLNLLSAHHYQIENRFPILIESAGTDEDKLQIFALLLDKNASHNELAREVVIFLKQQSDTASLEAKKVDFTFYADPKLNPQGDDAQVQPMYEVDVESLNVSEHTVPDDTPSAPANPAPAASPAAQETAQPQDAH